MTNASVEAGLVFASLVLGVFNAPPAMIGWSASLAIAWWLVVHQARLHPMMQTSKPKALGSFLVAIVAIMIIHPIAFGFGYILHSIAAPK